MRDRLVVLLELTKRFRSLLRAMRRRAYWIRPSPRGSAERGLEFALGLLPFKVAPAQQRECDAWFCKTRIELQCSLRTGGRLRSHRCWSSSLVVG
jgi:hypothetical protein